MRKGLVTGGNRSIGQAVCVQLVALQVIAAQAVADNKLASG